MNICHTLIGVHYYPCDRGGCWIECQCKLCSGRLCNMGESDDETDEEDQEKAGTSKCEDKMSIEENELYKCQNQCRKHDITLRRNFDLKVHCLSVSVSGYQMDGKKYYKHEGIPQSCNHCQEDLLDHQIFHKIIHRQCKFCLQHAYEMHDAKTRDHYIHNYNWLYFDLEPKTCQYCHKMLRSSKSRREHELKMHENKNLYVCKQCQRKFSAKVSLEYHQTVKCTGINPFSCKNCDMKFLNYSEYRTHRRAEKGIKEPVPNKECNLCKKSMSRDVLRRHMREVHGMTQAKFMHLCTICDEKFKRTEKLERHYIEKHDKTKYHCLICKEEFTRRETLQRHTKEKHENLVFSCPECYVKFTRRDTVKQHIKEKHLKIKEYSCTRSNCNKKFGQKGNQKRHTEKCKKWESILKKELNYLHAY